jgi:hypothetical protein
MQTARFARSVQSHPWTLPPFSAAWYAISNQKMLGLQLNSHSSRLAVRPQHAAGVRYATLEAGEDKSGHIKTDSDEGILFFDSAYRDSHRDCLLTDRQTSFHCVSNGFSDFRGRRTSQLWS